MEIVFNRRGTDPLFQAAESARALRLAAARDAMHRGWSELGGALSPIGLPVHRQIKAEGSVRDPFEHCASFRGGVLTLSDDGRRATIASVEEVHLACVGVEWLGASGDRRALSGVVAIHGPASGSVDVGGFPDRGALPPPVAGRRLAALDLPILRAGRLQDYWLWVGLRRVGATDVTGSDGAGVIRAAARRLGGAIQAAAGGARGDAAEGLVLRRSFKESVVAQATRGAEVSAPVCLRLHWNTLGARPAAPQPRRETDGPTTIADWTHRIVVPVSTGIGGASEGGRQVAHPDACALYFRAWTTTEARSIAVEIPGPPPVRATAR